MESKQPSHTKKQYLESSSFREYRDALAVILEDGKQYTKDEVNKVLDDFLKHPVVEKKN